MQTFGKTPATPEDAAVDDELTRFLELQGLAVEEFEPQTYSGPTVLFRSAHMQTGLFRDPLMGWGKLVTEGLVVHEIPHGHREMFVEPTVAVLAEKLANCLSELEDDEVANLPVSSKRG